MHGVASRGFDGLAIALLRVGIFRCPAACCTALVHGGGRIFFGGGVSGDSNRVARFEKFQRGLAVDSENGVLDFGVGRRIDAASKQFVARLDAFAAAGVGGIFEDNGVARLSDREIRFGGDNHSEGLHVGDGFDVAVAVLEREFAKIFRAALRRDCPQNVSEIFETEFRGFVEIHEFRVDLKAVALIFHFGFAGRGLQQRSSMKSDLEGASGAAIVDGFGAVHDGGGGRRRDSGG